MDVKKVVSHMRLYLFDMDGTLYLGDRLYPFTMDLLDTIRKTGGTYLFMTNNSSKSVDDYVNKLKRFGISAAREDFMTSSQATAYYLHKYHEGKKLYVCGTKSFKAELRREGFEVTEDVSEVECIVMGFDTELTFQKLYDVSYLLLTKPELPYIATNPDLVCPTEFGSVPDCGSVCIGIKNATGKEPIVIGKPSPLMPQLAMEKMGVGKENTCVVGDRIYTDVLSAVNAGVTGILVLSGETTREILESSSEKPHLVIQDAGEILDALRLTREQNMKKSGTYDIMNKTKEN